MFIPRQVSLGDWKNLRGRGGGGGGGGGQGQWVGGLSSYFAFGGLGILA